MHWSVSRSVCSAVILLVGVQAASAQDVGDAVVLESTNPAGVPVHPGPNDNSYVRWANGTLGTVTSTASPRGWLEIQAGARSGWVVGSYVSLLQEPGDDEEEDPGAEILSYVVGTWNLEYLNDGRGRGFPEYTYTPPGPSYGSRTNADYQEIATIIRGTLDAAILILNEINGRNGLQTSVEMDRLIGLLGTDWRYELTASGRSQRVAILYDQRRARRDSCFEIGVPEQRLNSSDIFEKDPLVCQFTFLAPDGTAMNDLIVVGLHLASGQNKRLNHNRAMEVLVDSLHRAQNDGRIAAGEMDLLVGGDLNASRYDTHLEDFWTDLDQSGFDIETLAPADGTLYPGTRLAGVPLFPRSQIDYLMASTSTGGLADELVQLTAQVRTDLLPNDFNLFREHLSDHLPVTVRILVVQDNDP